MLRFFIPPFFRICALGVLALYTSFLFAAENGAIVVRPPGRGSGPVSLWLESSLHRVYPHTQPGSTNLNLLAARNSRIAFQLCVQNRQTEPVHLSCRIQGADDLKPQVRFVGLVPVRQVTQQTDISELEGADEIPGLVPDPLLPQSQAHVGCYESRSFWITLNIPPDARPGVRQFIVETGLTNSPSPRQGVVARIPVNLEISDFLIKPRHDFPVTHWWRGEATWDYYKLGMLEDERWWQYTRWQLEDMLSHGSDVIYVPMFSFRREIFQRPCQLLIVNETSPGQYQFDWTQVKRFTDMCKEIGFKEFEWPHMWIYWGVKNPMRVYTKKGDAYQVLWDPGISGFSDTYLNFLKQLLPQMHDFLARERILDKSYFHLSDEPGPGEHLANYKRARQFLRDIAPWMKVMDALSNVEYGKQQLTDIPIPIVSAAQAYEDARIPHWVYFCTGPRGKWLNRFMDTPLPKIRMAGFLFYRHQARGFLHWGFNYWHKADTEVILDPFSDGTGGRWPSGDPFEIYPGPDGHPIDSLRWEVFAEALQDYAILQTAGIRPDDPLLADLHTFADFPKNEQWIQDTLAKILKGRHE